MANTRVNIIHLAGQGDIELKVVSAETFAWVFTGGDAPACQVEASWESDGSESREEITARLGEVIPGERPNDRALGIVSEKFNGDTFKGNSLKELMAFLSRNGLEIDQEYEGYIY